jgi:hypothetical protein
MMHISNGGTHNYHSSHKERRISDLAALNINMRSNHIHSTPGSRSLNEDSDNNEHSTVKSSARVLQLKRELEDLDARLI